jgi:membrane protease YdiL (CAAX protease family)
MSLVDKNNKLFVLAESIIIFLLSQIAVYCVSLLSSKINLYEISNNRFPLWRYNSFLTLPYLVSALTGLAIVPMVWEKVIRKTGFKEIGLFIPKPLYKELIYGTSLLALFITYRYIFLTRNINIFRMPVSIILLMFLSWLITSFTEEILYRGVMQRRMYFLFGYIPGLILASVLFAFAGHTQEPFFNNLIFRLPFGIILGYLYLRKQNLLVPILVHCVFNFLCAS